MTYLSDTNSLLDTCLCGERPYFVPAGYPRSIRCCGSCVRTSVQCQACGDSIEIMPTQHAAVWAWNKHMRQLKKK
jgi:hypothetical protein